MNGITTEIIKINFEHLHDFKIPYGKKIGLVVYLDNIAYQFILNIKKPKDKLLIIGTEPEGFSNHKIEKPYFEKYYWEFEQSTIFYNDPTYFIDETITAGLCIGTEDDYYLEKIIEILKILINKSEVTNDNILFYGSTVCGFTSLLLSIYFKNSTSLSDNPKIYGYDIESNNIELNELKSTKKHCFSNMSNEVFIEKYNKRLNIIEAIKQENYVPNAYLILNYANYNPQYLQFFKDLTHLKDPHMNKITTKIQWDTDKSVLDKEETINLINNIFLTTSHNKIRENNEKFPISNETILKLLKYNTCRIDLKMEGDNNKINIMNITENTNVTMPEWLNENGGEGIILFNDTNTCDIKLRCIGTGPLSIKLRGIDFRDKFDNRIPIYINYTKFSINGFELLNEEKLTWHDEPFTHIENIELSKILDLHIEWNPC